MSIRYVGGVASNDEDARERFVALGEIAAEVAHELRNVLQVISASAFLARQDPEKSAPHIAKIEKNARLAHSIVDDLMALARGDAAHAESTLVADVLVAARSELTRTPSGENGARSETKHEPTWVDAVSPPSLRMRVHPGLLARLLHALYENAIAVSQGRGCTLETRAFVDDTRGLVVLEVHDDGPGVPAAIAPRIFEPLVTGRPGGSGLGLALAKRIADAHGGTITLVPPASEQGRDRGATFRIELPARTP